MGLKHWLVKQAIKRKLKKMRKEGKDVSKILAVWNALKNPQTSEFWMTLTTVLLTVLAKFVPGFYPALVTVAGFFGEATPETFLAGALMYIFGRFFKKAATANGEE